MANTSKKSLVVILILLSIIIAIVPLVFIKNSEFEGADGQTDDVISEISPEYEPWADVIMEPPGGETESLLFSLQAAIGAGIIGAGFGYFIARSKFSKDTSELSN